MPLLRGRDRTISVLQEPDHSGGGIITGSRAVFRWSWGRRLRGEGAPSYDSEWFDGDYGFIFGDPQSFEAPIPCKGRRRIFTFKP